jgi:alpha-glucuronidase
MKVNSKRVSLIVLVLVSFFNAGSKAEDGYRLWLRYDRIAENELVKQYIRHTTELIIEDTDPVITAAREELQEGLNGMLGENIRVKERVSKDGAIIIGTPKGSSIIRQIVSSADMKLIGDEGYIIRSTVSDNHPVTVIASNRPGGVLYGAFHLLRLIQTRRPIESLSITEAPRIQKRLLNHWDNLNGSVERGYAGNSIWKWDELPEKVDKRYRDYARANASIGINGTALNNVNSQAEILTDKYIEKAAKIADVLRPYGIHIYFSVKFSAPVEIGG